MYMWREFDIGEIRDELAQISDIGFDMVRLFALTQDFLPESRNRGFRDGCQARGSNSGRERRRARSCAHADRPEHERSNLVAVLDAGSAGPAGRSVFGSGHPAIAGAACWNLCARACRRRLRPRDSMSRTKSMTRNVPRHETPAGCGRRCSPARSGRPLQASRFRSAPTCRRSRQRITCASTTLRQSPTKT